jgi:eukaryotic-like serine/threonine-protein kinase
MSDLTNQIIGGYQLEALIGPTETGGVYRARHLAQNKLYAFKVVHPALAQEPSFRAAFRQQSALVRALRHPHIVDVAEAGVRDGLCYLVMEWLPDGTLRDLLGQRDDPATAWSLALALDLVRQAAEALDFAHAQGFVHGSVKPNNLLLVQHNNGRVGMRYTVKLADFGLAWLAIHSETAAEAVWADSLIYAMAPERCQGLDVDGRADVYALGVILYEIATGSPPFAAQTLDAAVYRHVYTPPTPPRQLAPNLPPALEAIILRCLAKAPADRFAHAAELAAALQTILLSPALAPRPKLAANSLTAPISHTPMGAVAAPHVNALDQYGRTLEARALTGDGLSIGRAPGNDLVLDAPAIESRHLLVDWDGQAALVTNLSGGNNVVIGDTTLVAGATRSWEWDEPIRLGSFWLRLEAAPPDGIPAPTGPVAQLQAFTSEMESEAIAPAVDSFKIVSIAPVVAHAAAPIELLTDRIGIVLDQPTLTITPGRGATFRLTLANLGNLVDHLTVTVEQAPPGWVTGPPPVLQLNPGVQGLVTLNINIPQLPESRAGDYPISIRARSRENPQQSNMIQALWTVLRFESSTFDVKPKRIRRRLRGTYRLIVRNMGNAPARYQLSASDDEEALRYQFAEEQLELEPGASIRLNLVARPNRVRWFGLSQQHRFTVQSKPDGDTEPQTASVQFEQAAVIARWMIVVAVLLLLGGLAGLWFWYRPNISALNSDPPSPVLGQPFVISWQVTNAPTVELRVNGTAVAIPPNASRQIFSGFASPPDIRLVARNIAYGQDSRNLLVNMVSPTPTATPIPTLRPTATPTLVPIPPTPTDTPRPSPTPVLPTDTPAPTNTPTSQTLCRASDFTTLRGEGPPLTPFLVYFDGRAVGGGTTNRNGQFSVTLGQLNESPGAHSVIVRNRSTREILRAVTCIVL